MEFTSDELERALEIWREAQRSEIEALLYAKQVLRSYRTSVKSEMRGVPRSSPRYRELKELEEGLENKVLDCHEAWMSQLSARRYA